MQRHFPPLLVARGHFFVEWSDRRHATKMLPVDINIMTCRQETPTRVLGADRSGADARGCRERRSRARRPFRTVARVFVNTGFRGCWWHASSSCSVYHQEHEISHALSLLRLSSTVALGWALVYQVDAINGSQIFSQIVLGRWLGKNFGLYKFRQNIHLTRYLADRSRLWHAA